MPAQWNGTLLLWSRGYANRAGSPESAPRELKAALLAQGYALAGSDYGSGGWALEQAVPAQIATIAAFAARHGQPRRIIAWGNSMGGLVTTALAEQARRGIDGGIAMCASIGGSLGMMNMALDGAQAFRALVAPDAGIALVGIADDRANGAKVAEALDLALKTPEGRARVALAGVLAGIPGWTSRDRAAPADEDAEAQVDEIGRAFVMGVFLPRGDQESRAGLGYSWTTGIDYRRQLARSGRASFVAGALSPGRAVARRRSGAVERCAAHSPLAQRQLTIWSAITRPAPDRACPCWRCRRSATALTSPSLQQGYAEAAGRRNFASLWLRQAGHCGFSGPQMLASLRYLEARLDRGRWGARPPLFVAHRAAPMLRACFRSKACNNISAKLLTIPVRLADCARV